MSAPDTNIEIQESRHRPSLLGIKGVLVFAVLAAVLLGSYRMYAGNDASAFVANGEVVEDTSVVATDVYAPGTNSTATPAATD